MPQDGRSALIADGDVARFEGDRTLIHGARSRALALLDGEAWVVVDEGGVLLTSILLEKQMGYANEFIEVD